MIKLLEMVYYKMNLVKKEIVDRRNCTIDLMKFIFSIVIVMHHALQFKENIFVCGYLAVEFYFIVSGYLLMKKIETNNCNKENIFVENLMVIKKKYLSIFPYFILAVIAGNIFYNIRINMAFNMILRNIFYSFSDLLLLQMFGFTGFFATGVSWYLSTLIIITFILYPILYKFRKMYVCYIAPIIIMFIYGYIVRNDMTIGNPVQIYGFLYKGLFRGLAGMSLGCISYYLSNVIRKNNLLGGGRKCFLAIVEIFGYVISIVFMMIYNNLNDSDFIIILLLFISITISFSKQSITYNFLNYKICNFLGVFSLSIFLNHYFVSANIARIFPTLSPNNLFIVYCLIVICLSVLNYFIGKKLAILFKIR